MAPLTSKFSLSIFIHIWRFFFFDNFNPKVIQEEEQGDTKLRKDGNQTVDPNRRALCKALEVYALLFLFVAVLGFLSSTNMEVK